VDGIILWRTYRGNIGWVFPLPWNSAPVLLGFFFIFADLMLLVQTISLFMTIVKGTLASWDATQKLVVKGLYRYDRNPMISGVFAVLLGEATLLGSVRLLGWSLFAVLLNMVYVSLLEEQGLLMRFGTEYTSHKQHVPRWIPRIKP
jgi:protein-S-isoprenylcysteine O-methyltransferase Ste14